MRRRGRRDVEGIGRNERGEVDEGVGRFAEFCRRGCRGSSCRSGRKVVEEIKGDEKLTEFAHGPKGLKAKKIIEKVGNVEQCIWLSKVVGGI